VVVVKGTFDVSERAARRDDSLIFIVQGGPAAHHHFVGWSLTRLRLARSPVGARVMRPVPRRGLARLHEVPTDPPPLCGF